LLRGCVFTIIFTTIVALPSDSTRVSWSQGSRQAAGEKCAELNFDNIDGSTGISLRIICNARSSHGRAAFPERVFCARPRHMNGQSAVLFALPGAPDWLLKLPRESALNQSLAREFEATEALHSMGVRVPETFLCLVRPHGKDAYLGEEMAALLKADLDGWDLTKVAMALSSQPGLRYPQPQCTKHRPSNRQDHLATTEYIGIVRSGLPTSGIDPRALLQQTVMQELHCMYGRLAAEWKKQLVYDEPSLLIDIKPDNIRWAKAPGEHKYHLHLIDFNYLNDVLFFTSVREWLDGSRELHSGDPGHDPGAHAWDNFMSWERPGVLTCGGLNWQFDVPATPEQALSGLAQCQTAQQLEV